MSSEFVGFTGFERRKVRKATRKIRQTWDAETYRMRSEARVQAIMDYAGRALTDLSRCMLSDDASLSDGELAPIEFGDNVMEANNDDSVGRGF